MNPLTHHEILGWVEPFTRRGRHADLAASNRIERRIVFKPKDHATDVPLLAGLRETLQLESPAPGSFRLTRFLRLASGLVASLETEGTEPGDLLARIDTVAPEYQFRFGPGFAIAQCYRLERAPAGTTEPPLTLTGGLAQVEALTLTLTVPAARREPAELNLAAPAGDMIDLPEDLLAVLGWSWTRLTHNGNGWRGELRLRGRGADRGRDAERKLERTAQHLAETLAEPPARFHERRVAARWRVTFRRAVPLLVCVGLVAGTAMLPKFELAPDNPLRMMIFNGPPLLLALFFCMRELPRIEIPPWPRRSTVPSWRKPQGTDAH